MDIALLFLAAGMATWIIAKLVIILAPLMIYSSVASGSVMTAFTLNAGAAGTIDAALIAVQLLVAAWALFMAFKAWRKAIVDLGLAA